ncbi:uncharacterized protein [Diadema setosum]|uniref:uncharacterized protein n=1 Tax=Diadema setosum TaxID=31175 RepID=UPI003B3B8761
MRQFDLESVMDSRPASPKGHRPAVYLAGELLLKSLRDSLEIEEHKERLSDLNGKLHLAERRVFMAERKAGALMALAKMARRSSERAERAEERARLAEAKASREEERARLAEDKVSQEVEQARLAEAKASQEVERARVADAKASRGEERARLAEAKASRWEERARLAEAKASQQTCLARLAEARASREEERARFAEARVSRAEEGTKVAEEFLSLARKDVRSAEERARQEGERVRELEDKLQALEKELAEARRQTHLASVRPQGPEFCRFQSSRASQKWSATNPATGQSSTLFHSFTSNTAGYPPSSGSSERDTVSIVAARGGVARGNEFPSPPPPSFPSTYVWDRADLKPFAVSGGPMILGSGCYGTVYLHRHRSSNEPIAVKTMTLPDCPRAMKAKVEKIEREAALLDLFGREEFFPRYLGCLEVRVGCVGLAMEFVGDPKTGKTFTVGKAIAGHVSSVRHADWLQIALDLACGLQVIHKHGYLMNDLKGDNALIYMPPTGHRWRAKIIDFGLVTSQSNQVFTRFCGHVKAKYRRGEIYRHIAPEVALQDRPKSVRSDVFQLGRLLWAMGMTSGDRDLTDIGEDCRSPVPIYRPAVDAVVEELRRLVK